MPGIPTIEPYPMPTAAELPQNTARWGVDPDRAVLLIHDMQRYFLRPVPDPLRYTLVETIRRLRERCAAVDIPVAYTAQPGGMTESQRGLLVDFWGPGMRTSSVDREVVDALVPAPRDWLLTKWRYSAFVRTGLAERMQASGRDQIVLCGVYAHVGVLATAVDAFSRDIETTLVGDAVADFSPRHHHLALEYAAARCAVVTTAKEILG